MSKLLRADFSRLFKDKVFLFSAAGMALYGLAICVAFYFRMLENGTDMQLEEVFVQSYGLAGMLPLPGLVLAAFCSLHVGTEFSEGTIRNKLVVGHSRKAIYLSGFLTCAAGGALMNICYLAVMFAVGIPLFGFFTAAPGFLLTLLADGMLMLAAYAGIFYCLNMLMQNRAVTAVVSMAGVIGMMVVSVMLILRIYEPETINAMMNVDGEVVWQTVENTRYLSDAARRACQFAVDFLPTGQSLQISAMEAPNPGWMAACSAGIILASNIGGMLTFARKDLK